MTYNTQLEDILDAMRHVKILVIGDVMLDVYEHCVVKRISPEAPVPIATIIDESIFLGGAGNVAKNVRALGATVSLAGVIGDDREGMLIHTLLRESDIEYSGIVTEKERMTTTKKRIVSGSQQLMRIDREVTTEVSDETSAILCAQLSEKIQQCDAIVISDYCKGLLTESIISFIKNESEKWGIKVCVDSKSRNLTKYSGMYLLKPNKAEAEMFSGEPFTHDYTNLEHVGKKMSELLGVNLVITLGADGMALFEPEKFVHKKTLAREVFDVSGAGDTVLAVIAIATATGANLETAVDLSNHAAGYVVSRLGTTVCDVDTLTQILKVT